MPIVDMPLEELRRYPGRTSAPADFDTFWDKSLREQAAVDPQVELREAKFQTPFAQCFDLYFTGVKGARIYAKYVRPVNAAAPHPAVLKFHGYTGDCGDWNELLPYAAAGMSIAAMDCRGQGGRSEDVGGVRGNTHHGHIIRGLAEMDPEKLLFRDIFLDSAQLARVVMGSDEVDADRVGAFGGSQGGALTLACASLVPQIRIAAPMYPFLCDYRRVWDMDLDVDAYAELKEYFRHFDPRHEQEQAIFGMLDYIDLQFLASRIRAQLTMFTGLMDNICPPSTQFAAYNKMVCKKNVVLYPDFGHEWLPDALDMTYQLMLAL
ncbi:MAG: acetylxylan esterase [Eubacteriales bacterium]|nr:acetylxylan esterase [Eubacteriales bacterium]